MQEPQKNDQEIIADLHRRLKAMEAQLQVSSAHATQLEEQLEGMDVSLATSKATVKDLQTSKASVKGELDEARTALSQEQNTSATQAERISALEQRQRELQAALNDKTAELDALRQSKTEIIKVVRTIKSIADTSANPLATLASITTQLEAADTLLTVETTVTSTVEGQSIADQASAAGQQEELRVLHESNAALTLKVSELQSQLEEKTQALAALDKTVEAGAALVRQNDELQIEADSLIKELEALRAAQVTSGSATEENLAAELGVDFFDLLKGFMALCQSLSKFRRTLYEGVVRSAIDRESDELVQNAGAEVEKAYRDQSIIGHMLKRQPSKKGKVAFKHTRVKDERKKFSDSNGMLEDKLHQCLQSSKEMMTASLSSDGQIDDSQMKACANSYAELFLAESEQIVKWIQNFLPGCFLTAKLRATYKLFQHLLMAGYSTLHDAKLDALVAETISNKLTEAYENKVSSMPDLEEINSELASQCNHLLDLFVSYNMPAFTNAGGDARLIGSLASLTTLLQSMQITVRVNASSDFLTDFSDAYKSACSEKKVALDTQAKETAQVGDQPVEEAVSVIWQANSFLELFIPFYRATLQLHNQTMQESEEAALAAVIQEATADVMTRCVKACSGAPKKPPRARQSKPAATESVYTSELRRIMEKASPFVLQVCDSANKTPFQTAFARCFKPTA